MITFSSVQKSDISMLANIYAKAFNKEWEQWTPKKSKEIIEYRYKKNIKIKVVYNKRIVWAFFSDVKPLFCWNVLNDGDVFIDPEYQKLWIWKQLFIHGIEYAKKKFHVVWRGFYTFKDGYQYKRYKRIGFSDSDTWVWMSGKIDDVLKNLKK